MAPIHDTDIAAERWNQAEWSHYELWEKTEHRFKRRKQLWIALTVVLFIILSAVPTVQDRWPKWRGMAAARRLSQELNRMKRDAGIEKSAFRIRFADSGTLQYTIERQAGCADATAGTVVRTSELIKSADREEWRILKPSQGMELGVPGLVDRFCYDPVAGYASVGLDGIGIIRVKDLAEQRLDRMSLLLLSGPSAETTFD